MQFDPVWKLPATLSTSILSRRRPRCPPQLGLRWVQNNIGWACRGRGRERGGGPQQQRPARQRRAQPAGREGPCVGEREPAGRGAGHLSGAPAGRIGQATPGNEGGGGIRIPHWEQWEIKKVCSHYEGSVPGTGTQFGTQILYSTKAYTQISFYVPVPVPCN